MRTLIRIWAALCKQSYPVIETGALYGRCVGLVDRPESLFASLSFGMS